MKKNYTHLVLVLDESGSMSGTQDATREGVNGLLEQQNALPGDLTSALYKFNTKASDGETVTQLTKENYRPLGGTALNDAFCKAIDTEGRKLAALPESQRPDRVVVVVVTDGYENASTEFKKSDVKSRIATQETVFNWQFIFLGANIDAFAEGQSYGLRSTSLYQFNMNPDSIKASYCAVGQTLTSYRSGQTETVNMTEATKTADVR